MFHMAVGYYYLFFIYFTFFAWLQPVPEQRPTPELGDGVPAQVAQPVSEQRPTPEVGNGVPALVASKTEVV